MNILICVVVAVFVFFFIADCAIGACVSTENSNRIAFIIWHQRTRHKFHRRDALPTWRNVISNDLDGKSRIF